MVSPVLSPTPEDLSSLRDRLDIVDRELHRLLQERFAIVEAIGRTKGADEAIIRPDREVDVVTNRLALHDGAMPQETLIHIWRVLIGGACAVQRPYRIHVTDTLDAARYLYGPVEVVRWPTASDAIAALADKPDDVAVLPDASAWWVDGAIAPAAHAFARFTQSDGTKITILGGARVGASTGPKVLCLRHGAFYECDTSDLAGTDTVLGRYAPSPFTIPVAQ